MRNKPLERSLTVELGVASSIPRLFSRSFIYRRPPKTLSWTPGRKAFGRTLEHMVDSLVAVVVVFVEAVVCSGSDTSTAAVISTPYLSAEALRNLIAVIAPFGFVDSRLGTGVRVGCGGLGVLSGLDSWWSIGKRTRLTSAIGATAAAGESKLLMFSSGEMSSCSAAAAALPFTRRMLALRPSPEVELFAAIGFWREASSKESSSVECGDRFGSQNGIRERQQQKARSWRRNARRKRRLIAQ